MSGDVAYLRSLLGTHPDFPKKVCTVIVLSELSQQALLGDRLPRYFPHPPQPCCVRDSHHPFSLPLDVCDNPELVVKED
jgi:hypothetical protein